MSEAWEFTTRNDHSATSKQTIVVILGAAQRSQSIAPDLDDRLDCFVENLRRRAQLTRTNDERVSDHLASSATNNEPDNTATERQARKLEQNQGKRPRVKRALAQRRGDEHDKKRGNEPKKEYGYDGSARPTTS
ncbi:hypothetical protein L914_18734 [Phytophthora nicotianae]|uniref:Uncharacterized protein n=1 Tax=Phytophthora nicotianae TaxID=4792 RepID=W2MEM8_PHYNI|nr:hypothetical protein L914_18734 [Phytophthora nicotianae]